MSSLREDVVAILSREEGLRLVVYDDANGKPIVPGSQVIGHPTIGIGRALDTKGISQGEAEALLADDVAELLAAVPMIIPSWETLSDVRAAVLVCMAYQMGIKGLSSFKATLAAIGRGDFEAAARNMEGSKWGQQTPARAKRMARMMREG